MDYASYIPNNPGNAWQNKFPGLLCQDHDDDGEGGLMMAPKIAGGNSAREASID